MSNYFLFQYEWVEKHMGNDWAGKIILTPDKTLVNGHLLIDDRPNVKGWSFGVHLSKLIMVGSNLERIYFTVF